MKRILLFMCLFIIGTLAYAQPANDDCANAEMIACGGSLAAVDASMATALAGGTPCPGTTGPGVWYELSTAGINNGDEVSVTATPDASWDLEVQVLSGSCGALTCEVVVDSGTAGVVDVATFSYDNTLTYYIYISTWSSTATVLASFDLAVSCMPGAGAPTNDLCANPTPLPVGASDSCVNTLGTNVNATPSGEIPPPSCSSFGTGEDVWYSVMVPASGNVTVETSTAGGFADSGMSIYSGTCGALAEVECDDDAGAGSFSLIELIGQTPGDILLIRVFEFGNDAEGEFNICAFEPCVETAPNLAPACGETVTYPTCPGIYANDLDITWMLCPDPGTYATIEFTYIDLEGSTSQADLCWDQLNVTGITTEVVCGEADAGSAPAGPFQGGDCFYHPTAGECITVQFTSDGSAGETGFSFNFNCVADPTTISCPRSVGPLPVELINFTATSYDKVNTLTWETASEINTEWHIIERAISTVNDKWEEIGRVKAAGESLGQIEYTFDDASPLQESYYRIRTLDLDGAEEFSEVLFVSRVDKQTEITKVVPVPTKDFVTVDYISAKHTNIKVTITDISGRLLHTYQVEANKGDNQIRVDLQTLNNGFYLLTLDDGITPITKRVVKQ